MSQCAQKMVDERGGTAVFHGNTQSHVDRGEWTAPNASIFEFDLELHTVIAATLDTHEHGEHQHGREQQHNRRQTLIDPILALCVPCGVRANGGDTASLLSLFVTDAWVHPRKAFLTLLKGTHPRLGAAVTLGSPDPPSDSHYLS